MSQTVTKKISESKGARWAALIIVSLQGCTLGRPYYRIIHHDVGVFPDRCPFTPYDHARGADGLDQP